MSSTDPTTIKILQHLDEVRRVLASAQNLLPASSATPDIDDLMETGTWSPP